MLAWPLRTLGSVAVMLAGWAAFACSGETNSSESTGGTGASGGTGGAAGTGGGAAGASNCQSDQKLCAGACASRKDPLVGCDASGCNPCVLPHATAGCSATGTCSVSQCDPDWSDCNDSPVDGCETNLKSDKEHCGACGSSCLTQLGVGAVCMAGKCEINGGKDCEKLGFFDCDGDNTTGCEVDTNTDPNNCGLCGKVCSNGQTCSGGKCQ